MKYIFFIHECYSYPIAKHLQDEGNEIIVGIIDNYGQLRIPNGTYNEKPQERIQRLSVYDGLVQKKKFQVVMSYLASVPKNKQDDYFFFFDHNDMYNVANMILKMGFKQGLFPYKDNYQFETNREIAKKWAKQHYEEIEIEESVNVKTVKDAIKFLTETDDVYVIKSNGNLAPTYVPKTDDPEIARRLAKFTLQKYKKDYEKGGILLEKKILNCYELTPIMVFYNGKPVYSLVEMENKEFGSGNIGILKGGNQALSIKTELDSRINDIAFPPVIYEEAKKCAGLAVFDAGLYYDGDNFYFGEFCEQRFGWDGIFSEMVMRDDGKPFVTHWFEDIMNGKNPLINQYGASIRLFSAEGKAEEMAESKDDIPIIWDESVDNNLFVYRMKKSGNEIVSIGGFDYLACMTAASDSIDMAVDKVYERIKEFHFDRLYYRPKFDFLSKEYQSSILNRIEAIKDYL